MRVLTRSQMAEADRRTIEERRVPSLVLMEEAGRETVGAILDTLDADPERLRILVVCGKGNNGGDGLVVARLLHRLGAEVRAVLLWAASEYQGDARANLQAFDGLDGDIQEAADLATFQEALEQPDSWDVVVDAVFGTGLTGPADGWRGEALDLISACTGFVVSVDVPSGLRADSPWVEGPVVEADLTVTMAAPKPCLVLPPASAIAGEVVVAEIGIPVEELEFEGPDLFVTDPLDVEDWLDALHRPLETHKAASGRVLVVAGSVGKGGAAVLASLAALRGGAGLVTLAVPRAAWPGVAPACPEVMVEPIGEEGCAYLGPAHLRMLRELASGADVLAVGPGLGRHPETLELVRALAAELELPRVLDADALVAIGGGEARGQGVQGAAGAPLFLTPHPGEMGGLLATDASRVLEDRLGAVRRCADQFGAHVLLKGYRSLAAEPSGAVYVNPTGGPALATGGTGDVLTGLVAALLAQGVPLDGVLPAAAFLHGLSGDLLAETQGEIGLVATDLLEALPAVLQSALQGWTGPDPGSEEPPQDD